MNNISKLQVPQNVLDFYKELTTVQESQKPLTNIDFSEVDLKKDFAQGNYAFRKGTLKFNIKQFRNTLNEVIEVFIKHRNELEPELKKQAQYFKKLKDDELQEQVETFVLEKGLPSKVKEQKVAQEINTLILVNSIKPYFKMLAAGLQGLEELELWKENICPVCGWDPLLAKIEENGKRVLHCSLCDHEWQYKALKCIHCGNEDHERIQIIKVPGVEGREIQVCDKCQGYVKQIKTKEVIVDKNMVIEDVKSLFLDLIAEKEGYKHKF